MCSIFGVFDIKTDAVELRKKALELSRLMRHRGPDWSGIYASDNAILAHERLSIVDVNAGAQPLYNVKKTHILAVNGEIYNHQALRAEYGDRARHRVCGFHGGAPVFGRYARADEGRWRAAGD